MKQLLDLKSDFPILSQKVNGKQLIYLDNSATSQKPQKVIDSITEYYSKYNSNVHRAIHKLGEQATLKYEEAHEKVANFINASKEEIIFTRNTTESINLLSHSLQISKKHNIIVTEMEHHSNLVPWQQICKETGAELRFIPIDKDGKLNLKKDVTEWADIPNKFEAGTPNIEGAIALGAAVDYLENIDMDEINKNVKDLVSYLMKRLLELDNISIYGPENGDRTALVSFNLLDIHPHDVAEILDKEE